MSESKTRSWVKSITWRVAATLNGFIVTYCFTGNVSSSALIAIVANISGFVLYYAHERIWNGISWRRL